MTDTILALVPLRDYQEIRAHLFPSYQSCRWFMRKHRAALIEGGAILEIAGRTQINPAAFDAVVLAQGKSAIKAP